MHFALPPRKTSQPPPYVRNSNLTAAAQRRRKQIQLLAYAVLGLVTLYLVYEFFLSFRAVEGTEDGAESIQGLQDVVIVTVFDNATMSEDYVRMIRANRDDYAARHGYKNFYTNTSAYFNLVDPSPSSWSLVPALRQALTDLGSSTFFWSLSADAFITNPSLSLETHILEPLESLMLKDIPVVPPDSVIHTFSHLTPCRTHLILSQDMDNLAHSSFILRNTPFTSKTPDNWAHFFLDAWFDPLYRAYAFQKAENHALEHLVQWHPTILAKLVLIDQRKMNSYNYATPPQKDPVTGNTRTHDSMWQGGDLVVNLKGCRTSEKRDCEEEMRHYFAIWEKEVERLDGKKPPKPVKVA
ncbi:putative alpha-1,6-mannosyltransferase mnn11 [Cladophialophora chaetospira]|uniref:Alpha-1,6-mannosyltransferase mnn11 n=1 Tax=Cladophialophora chaetospira TaxID=386627 RepID=A0AA38X7D8_9EURO|nr:putative alpha-1,6-mannosyltransferase mnn11 [Cladophialophora chaetospira]